MNEADASLKSKAPGTRPGGVVRIRRSLISVWDKAGIIDLAAALHQLGVGILSTGGTAQALREAEIPVTTVESITGYPPILDGRVKTLHPAIFAAILGKDDAAHRAQLDEMGITPVDLVVVNLYPFESRALDASLTEAVELIDIGGVSLLRAAQRQGKELSFNNIVDLDAAWNLIWEFDHPAAAIIKHATPCGAATRPEAVDAYRAARACDPVSAFGGIVALNGDVDEPTAAEITEIFTEAVIAPGFTAGARALLARKGNLRILECAAPSGQATSPMSLRGAERRSNLLIGIEIRSVSGGLLVQGHDTTDLDETQLRLATPRAPSDAEMADLRFAWKVCKWVKSNAIVLAYGGATVGIGSGQPNRVVAG